MKHVLSQQEQQKITNSIIQLLADNNCTLANYEEIHELVIKHYEDNATLSSFVADKLHTTIDLKIGDDIKALCKNTRLTKKQSIIDKAKSIAFDSCDDRIHKLCREIIELAQD